MPRKKKDSDFQKVKIKVGKKLIQRNNITKTEFKSKKIILKEAQYLGDNPIASLARNVSSNTQFKLVCLSKVNDGYFDSSAGKITGETINTLAKLLLDDDERVRAGAVRCLKKCINKLIAERQSVSPFITILLTYIKCAITHLNHRINVDAKELMEFVITKCEPSLFNQLMTTIQPRLTFESQLTAKDFELAALIVKVIASPDRQFVQPNTCHEFKWNRKENYYDISQLTIPKPNLRFNISFQLSEEEDVKSNFIATVTKLVNKELACVEKHKTDNLVISLIEAHKLIASLRIANILGIKWTNLINKLQSLTISNETINNRSSKKVLTELNATTNLLNSIVNERDNF